MSAGRESAQCSRQVMINVKMDPTERRKDRFGAFDRGWNGFGGGPHLFRCLRLARRNLQSLQHACICEIDVRGIESGIEFDGAREMLRCHPACGVVAGSAIRGGRAGTIRTLRGALGFRVAGACESMRAGKKRVISAEAEEQTVVPIPIRAQLLLPAEQACPRPRSVCRPQRGSSPHAAGSAKAANAGFR